VYFGITLRKITLRKITLRKITLRKINYPSIILEQNKLITYKWLKLKEYQQF